MPEGPILAKDLAVEYKYLSNTSEWFFKARKKAEDVIQEFSTLKTGRTLEILILFIIDQKAFFVCGIFYDGKVMPW